MHNSIIRILAAFIFNKEKRKAFRRKYLRETCLLMVYQNLDKKLDSLNYEIRYLDKKLDSLNLHSQYFSFYNENCPGITLEEKMCRFYNHIPAATGDLALLQKVLLILLSETVRVCEKNHISYWIQAGTLLGAARGGRFIPWDDDLDIGMTETELRKLKLALKDNSIIRIDDYYHFNSGYLGRFTRVKFKNPKINCFLDIPVYEYCSANNIDEAWDSITQKRLEFEEKLKSLAPKLSKVYHNEIITNQEDLSLIKEFYREEIKAVHQDEGNFIYWAHYGVPALWKRIFPVNMFFPLSELSFEGKLYKVPRRYKDYLNLQYNNYWLLPFDMEAKHVNAFSLFQNINEYKKILKEFNHER